MKNGLVRFEFYLQKLEDLMRQAGKEEDAAVWLFKNDARTPLFMLEALSRLYAALHNKKKFTRLKDQFKQLEDAIGAIDHYDSYAQMFLAHPTIPVPVREYMQRQRSEKIQYLNDLLIKNEWVGENTNRFKKIRAKLKEADWLQPKEEAKAVIAFYEEEIDDIKKFVKAARGVLTHMENQVHELRRSLRWLSIYPQALQGMVQLTDGGESEKDTQKYRVPEIINSPYNVMPDADYNTWFVMLETNYYYALSWMIAETGKLKDEGLEIFAVTEALQQTEDLSYDLAYVKSFEVLGLEKNKMNSLLAVASQIITVFIKEQNLDMLVYGLAHTQKTKSE
ncbi:MAG: hypothetical protein H7X88_00545 [Gloeobacteraceae cyanobacterium ES-bin-316]|nr:hypothetical protein [Ferruginibacter sp.]